MKTMKTWVLWGAVMLAVIGFTGCDNNGGDGTPTFTLSRIEITGMPFGLSGTPEESDPTTESVAFLIVMGEFGGTGVAVLGGKLPNGHEIAEITPVPGATLSSTVETALYTTDFQGGIMAYMGAAQDSNTPVAEFTEVFPTVRGTGDVTVMYVTIAGQANPMASLRVMNWAEVPFSNIVGGILTLDWSDGVAGTPPQLP
ncbi:MAG: hypothetical protein FWB78_05600 [Treponema sp.]|nr:hypothetical protein [Treponema sp.]